MKTKRFGGKFWILNLSQVFYVLVKTRAAVPYQLSDIKHETQSSVSFTVIKHALHASVLNGLKNERYYLFICEVIFKINVV